MNGLNKEQIIELRKEHGFNELAKGHKISLFQMLSLIHI